MEEKTQIQIRPEDRNVKQHGFNFGTVIMNLKSVFIDRRRRNNVVFNQLQECYTG